MKYNHAYDIAFSLNSNREDGHVTGQELRKAIIDRLTDLSDEELVEACGAPYDTYENDIKATPLFTTADADRLLGLADRFLENWAEDAIQSGERDRDYEERNDQWQAIRPMLAAAPDLLQELVRSTDTMHDIRRYLRKWNPEDIRITSLDMQIGWNEAAIAKARRRSCEDDTPEEACTCHQRSWYGPHHDTQCPLAEPIDNAKGEASTATPTCADRAQWAENAVTAYARAKEGRAYDPVADMASDLLTDLCHLLVREGILPDLILERAKTHYEEECAEEGIII